MKFMAKPLWILTGISFKRTIFWYGFPRENSPKRTYLLVPPEKISQINVMNDVTIPRGLGRSYGDAATNEGRHVTLMERINRFIHFDHLTGQLHAEAGCSLE
jgi:hypothetical protein